jgi:pimeloyl-ACP methyl ester carboxylesterase
VNGARKIVVDVDVTDCHLEGCRRIATDLFVPKMPLGEPVLWCCLPGGGASRAYFDLDVPRGAGEYSMARFAAERGIVVLTIDPPGVGESDAPRDGYELTPSRVADVVEFVVRDVTARLEAGEVEEAPRLPMRTTMGLGHSAGALLIVAQQARFATYSALVGMMALIPGSMKPELERIKVPTLVAMGDRDIAGSVAALPVQLPECRDLTLLTLPNTGHNHNRYDSRFRLWTRLLGWTDGLTAFTGE